MIGFSADWLSLREPFDVRARNPAVLAAVAAFLKPRSSVRIVDLACGTGSTFRAVNRHVSARQDWKLIDNDPALLSRAATALAINTAVRTVKFDLNGDLDAVLEGTVDLVTTSALLDLVSERWVERLALKLAARSIPLYAALSYDGRTKFTLPDPFDGAITSAVNTHQRTDKGFGPALGAGAATFAVARFEALGYSVVHGASDWLIAADDHDMQIQVLSGWTAAANDLGKLPLADTAAWLARRRLAGGSFEVGHVDFFATPSTTR